MKDAFHDQIIRCLIKYTQPIPIPIPFIHAIGADKRLSIRSFHHAQHIQVYIFSTTTNINLIEMHLWTLLISAIVKTCRIFYIPEVKVMVVFFPLMGKRLAFEKSQKFFPSFAVLFWNRKNVLNSTLCFV